MASIEMLGGNEAVAKRTQKLAKDIGELAFDRAHKDLNRFIGSDEDDLKPNQVDSVAKRQKARAIAKYEKDRNEGLHNDKVSMAVGLTALVRSSARNRIEEWLKSKPVTMFSPVLTEVGEAEGKPLYKMRLPQGAFSTVSSGIFFYPEARMPHPGSIFNLQDRGHEFDERIALSQISEVIRIEGDAGELWQSPYSNPDGTRREPPLKVRDIE